MFLNTYNKNFDELVGNDIKLDWNLLLKYGVCNPTLLAIAQIESPSVICYATNCIELI